MWRGVPYYKCRRFLSFGAAADLRCQHVSVEREIAVTREQLQQQQPPRGSVLEHMCIEQQQALSARKRRESTCRCDMKLSH
jgi:hypothetical protein